MLNTCVTIGYCPRVMFNAKNSMHAAAGKTKLDGCMLNEHNTVFASNRSAICNRCFPVPTRVLDEKLQTASPSLQPFLPGSLGDRPTNRLTDHATWSIKNRRSAQQRSQILLLSATTTNIYWSSRLDISDQLQQWAAIFSCKTRRDAVYVERRHTTI